MISFQHKVRSYGIMKYVRRIFVTRQVNKDAKSYLTDYFIIIIIIIIIIITIIIIKIIIKKIATLDQNDFWRKMCCSKSCWDYFEKVKNENKRQKFWVTSRLHPRQTCGIQKIFFKSYYLKMKLDRNSSEMAWKHLKNIRVTLRQIFQNKWITRLITQFYYIFPIPRTTVGQFILEICETIYLRLQKKYLEVINVFQCFQNFNMFHNQ